MPQQYIGIGTTPGDHTGSTLRAGGTIINENFTELYGAIADQAPGGSSGDFQTNNGDGTFAGISLATLKTNLGLTGTNSGDQTITLTGDVTGSGTSSFSATIVNSAITNAKLANMAAYTLKGNISASSAAPTDFTLTDLTEEATPATGDFLIGFESGGALRKFDVGNISSGVTPGGSSGDLQFNDAGNLGGSILKQGTNVISQLNSTNAQTFRIYATDDGGTNYFRGSMSVTDGSLTLGCETAGTGSANGNINLAPAGSGTIVLDDTYGGSHTLFELRRSGSWFFTFNAYSDPQNSGATAYNLQLNTSAIGLHKILMGYTVGGIGMENSAINAMLKWGDSYTQTWNAGITSPSSGVVEVNNGTLGTYRDLLVRNLTLSNSTSTTTQYIYGTTDGGSNYRRLYVKANDTSGDFRIGVEGLGTGATGNTLNINFSASSGIKDEGSSTLRVTDGSTGYGSLVLTNTTGNQSHFYGFNVRDTGTLLGSNGCTLQNGTNTTTQLIYGTYTDASNYRRMYLKANDTSGDFRIGVEGAGTGASGNTLKTDCNLQVGTSGTTNSFIIYNNSGGAVFGTTANALAVNCPLVLNDDFDATQIALSHTGVGYNVQIGSTYIRHKSSGTYCWSASATDAAQAADLFLYRDAANTLAQRNSTNAQAFNLYGTYTDGSNYRRMYLKANDTSGDFRIGVQGAGTGASGNILSLYGSLETVITTSADQYGSSSLSLRNRTGTTGALFTQTSTISSHFVDFQFATGSGSGKVAGIRTDDNTSGWVLARAEMQFGTAGSPSFISGFTNADGVVITGPSSNAISSSLWFKHTTSTSGIATELRDLAELQAIWVDGTHASRKGKLTFNIYDTAVRTYMIAEASGSAAKLAFFGSAAVVQPATTGTTTGYTGGGGTALTHSDTFTGNTGSTAYTIGDVVKALKDLGLLTA